MGECEGLAWLHEVPSEGLVIMQKDNFFWRGAMPRLGGCLGALPLFAGEVAELYLGELIVMRGGCGVACEACSWAYRREQVGGGMKGGLVMKGQMHVGMSCML